MRRVLKKILLVLLAVAIVCGVLVVFGSKDSNPEGYKTIGEIETPKGYKRIAGSDAAYASYLRGLPLKGRGSKLELYTGGNSRFQSLNYAVVDMPLLSNSEQCADVCMRLRAEYLFSKGKYASIKFQDINGKTHSYDGGASRKSFESYMRKVYGVANTLSLKREMKTRALRDIQPGDVFVYSARKGRKLGHAVMVVDVAENEDGKKAFLLAEGNTPARSIHVMRNLENPLRSPWFMLDEDAKRLWLTIFYFDAEDLRHF